MGAAQSTQLSGTDPRDFKRRRPSRLSRRSRISLSYSFGHPSISATASSSQFTVNEKCESGTIQTQEVSVRKGRRQSIYIPQKPNNDTPLSVAYASFLKEYPEYRLTWTLDSLRESDFGRLERTGETYVDYMGGSIYPESLIRVHTDFLSRSVMGNTHSVSNSSRLSLQHADEARAAVLTFFQAPPEYTVVFTANTTGALKLVGESYPFTSESSYILGADSHNSVHGIRQYAMRRGAKISYIQSTPNGGFDLSGAKAVLSENRPKNSAPGLFALTAQSNISNSKNPLSIISYATSLGYHVILDAAALAPTSTISLREHQPDAMAVSFYKMFGFPTGVGALIVKKSFLQKLERPWFAGGNVDVVQVPGIIVTRSQHLHEQFEDGTINYLSLPTITDGLHFLSGYLPFLPVRLSALTHYLVGGLSALRHDNGAPLVHIMSQTPKRRVRSVGQQMDTGSTVSLLFLYPDGSMISNSFIEWAATQERISLRTGCMCNPGGAAALLGISEQMQYLYPGVTLKDFETYVGRELGVVRISLGLASNFEDVWKVLRFASILANEPERVVFWRRWEESKAKGAEASL